MIESIRYIVMVFILSGLLYIPGIFYHRGCHLENDTDIYVSVGRISQYFVGVKNANRIYLRPASVQMIALLYFLIGCLGIIFCGVSNLVDITAWVLGGGLFLDGIIWIIVDIITYVFKRNL